MPSKTNQIGNLEVVSGAVDQGFLAQLNDRMRRIGDKLANVVTTTTAAAGGSISQLVLTVPGILAVDSTAAPLITLPAAQQFSQLTLILEQLPIGGPVTVQLFTNGTAWGPAVTATGMLTTVNVSSYPPIPQDALLRLAITSVPALLSGVSYPGSDLTFQLK